MPDAFSPGLHTDSGQILLPGGAPTAVLDVEQMNRARKKLGLFFWK